MMRYLLRRTLSSALTVVGISIVAFLLVALAPGDPIAAELRALGITAKPDTIARLREQYDLDAPLPVRYQRWALRCLKLDLGKSISSGRPVAEELQRAFGPTAWLTAQAMLWIIGLSLTLGYVACRYTAKIDIGIRAAAILSVSVPLYWLALLLLSWPPAPLLALAPSLSISRMIKQRVDAERTEDYVRFATATGATPAQILLGEVSRPVLPLIFTLWGNSLGYLLAGSVVIERIFGISGLGTLALQAISARDYPILQSYLLLSGILFIVSNWIADVLGTWADPRLRL